LGSGLRLLPRGGQSPLLVLAQRFPLVLHGRRLAAVPLIHVLPPPGSFPRILALRRPPQTRPARELANQTQQQQGAMSRDRGQAVRMYDESNGCMRRCPSRGHGWH
jgi:hypothetical protein